MAHWKVAFTRAGIEPPLPFGRTKMIVCAETRADAKRAVEREASPYYPITASKVDDETVVAFTKHCNCKREGASQ